MKNFTSAGKWEPLLLQHINANNNSEQTNWFIKAEAHLQFMKNL